MKPKIRGAEVKATKPNIWGRLRLRWIGVKHSLKMRWGAKSKGVALKRVAEPDGPVMIRRGRQGRETRLVPSDAMK